MIKAIITDFSRVLLFPLNEEYDGGLNTLNNELLDKNENYSFEEVFKLNAQLLNYYKDLSQQIPVYIFTSETIQEHPSIRRMIINSVTGILSAKELGTHKSDPGAYKQILNQLDIDPTEVIYVDDKQSNVDTAKSVGFHTILHTNNESTIDALEKLIAE